MFCLKLLKLTCPDHTSSMFHSQGKLKKPLDFMIGAFQIVLPFSRTTIDLLMMWPVSMISTSGQSEQNIGDV